MMMIHLILITGLLCIIAEGDLIPSTTLFKYELLKGLELP
jgi:hypothetical protein